MTEEADTKPNLQDPEQGHRSSQNPLGLDSYDRIEARSPTALRATDTSHLPARHQQALHRVNAERRARWPSPITLEEEEYTFSQLRQDPEYQALRAQWNDPNIPDDQKQTIFDQMIERRRAVTVLCLRNR